MKKFKVVKEFGCAKKGDVLEQNGDMLGFVEDTGDTHREMFMSNDLVEAYVEAGMLEEVNSCCDTLEKVTNFVTEKLSQYENDYNEMMEAYNNQEIPACVKVEAETVYYNMNKILKAINDLINE